MPKKTNTLKYYEAVGRRKTAVARVRLYIVGKDKSAQIQNQKVKAGELMVNHTPLDKAFGLAYERKLILEPLKLTDNLERFAVSIHLSGGGRNGQLEAVVHGLSRALLQVDKESFKPVLRKESLLTRDSRARERRKVGMGGKSRRAKQSPKR